MLKKQLFTILAGSILITGTGFSQSPPNTIDKELDALVQKAEAEAQSKFETATRRDTAPLWSDKVAAENAIIQLEVKKTLVNNFKGTASLQNPVIRAKLIEILNKSIIMESDLAELQNLVDQEKAKVTSQPASAQPVNATPTN